MLGAEILAGSSVVEVAAYIPGPVCTQILADLGATVTKVERPSGDPLRHMQPQTSAGDNPIFAALNRGKHHRALDLKTAEGAATLRELVASADVLVDGFRPGVLNRLGVGADVLCTDNPRLIYCSLSGYGGQSVQREVAGHDLNFVALSGLLGATTVAGVPALPGTQLVDMVSGLAAATAILAALQQRTHTGVGATLEIAMHDVAQWLMLPWLAVAQSDAPTHEPNVLTGALACYNVYRTADGRYLTVAALEPHFWANFCAAIGRTDLVGLQHDEAMQLALRDAVAACIAAQPLAHWRNVFATTDACVTPVLSVAEAAAQGFDMELPL